MVVHPAIGSRWRHYNGIEYEVTGIANDVTPRRDDYPITVVYTNVRTGKMFTRALYDWPRSMRPVQLAKGTCGDCKHFTSPHTCGHLEGPAMTESSTTACACFKERSNAII